MNIHIPFHMYKHQAELQETQKSWNFMKYNQQLKCKKYT